MVNITDDFSIGAFLCRNLLGHEPCHDFNPTGTGKRMARLNTRFDNLVNKFGGLSVGGAPSYNDNNPDNETGINYTLKDFLYFNDYDMNNFSFLELLDNKEESKLTELNENFVKVFKLNINGVLQNIDQPLNDSDYQASQDMIACVQEIVELSDFFRILIISQQEIDLSQEDYDMLGGSMKRRRMEYEPVNVTDENEYSLAKRVRGDFTPTKERSSSPLGILTPNISPRSGFINTRRPKGELFPEQPIQGQGSAPILQGPITAVASPPLPTNYDNFIKKLNYLRSGDERGWINSLDENGNNFFNPEEIKVSPFNFLYTNDRGNIDEQKIILAKQEITDVFKLYSVLFTYYIIRFNNQDNIYSINNSNFIRYGLFSYFANKLVANPRLPFKKNFFINLQDVQFNYQLGETLPDTLETLLGRSNVEILDKLAKISNTCPLTDKEANSMYNFESATSSAMAVDTGGTQKGGAGVETIYQVFKNNLLEYQIQANKYLNQDFNNFVFVPDDEAEGNQSDGSAMDEDDEAEGNQSEGNQSEGSDMEEDDEAQGNQSDGDDTLLKKQQWKLKKLKDAVEDELAPFRYYDNKLASLIKEGLYIYKDTRKPPAVKANEIENKLIEKIKERIETLYENFNTYLESKKAEGIEGFSDDLITQWKGVAKKLQPKHLKLVDYIKRNGARIFYGRHPPFSANGRDPDYISRPIKELNTNIFDKISGIFLTFNKNKQLIADFKEIKVEEVANALNAPFKTFVNLLLQKICNKIHTEIVPPEFGKDNDNPEHVYNKEIDIMEKVAQGKPIGGIDGTLLNAFIDTYKDNNDVFYGTATNTQEILDKVKDGNNQTDVINNALTTKLLDKLGGTRKKISDDILENNGTVVNLKFKMYCPVTSVLDAQGAFGSCYKGKNSPSIGNTGQNYQGLPMEIIIEMGDDTNKFLFTVNLNVSNISGGAQKVILEYYLSMSIGDEYFDTRGQQVETVVSTSQVMYLGANNTFQRAMEMLETQSSTVGITSFNILLDTMLDKIIPYISNKYMGDFGQELSAIVERSGVPDGATTTPPERRFLIDGDRPSFVRAGVLFLECEEGIDKDNSSILYATEASDNNVIIVKKDVKLATGGASKKKNKRNKRNKTKRKKQKKHKKTKLVKKKYSSGLKNKTIKKRKNKNKTKKRKIK